MPTYSLIVTRRDVGTARQLIGAGLQEQPQYPFEAIQRPFLAERCRERLVEPLAVAADAADDIGKQLGIGFAIGLAVDLAAEPVADKFADGRLGAEPGIKLQLIESLHCGKAREAPPARAALPSAGTGHLRRCCAHPPPSASRRFNSTRARQARTARPP